MIYRWYKVQQQLPQRNSTGTVCRNWWDLRQLKMAKDVDEVFSFVQTVSHPTSPTNNRPQPSQTRWWSLCRLDSRNSHRPVWARAPEIVGQVEELLLGRDVPIFGRNTSSDRNDSNPTWQCWMLVAFLLHSMNRYRHFHRLTRCHRNRTLNPELIQLHVRPIADRCLDAMISRVCYFYCDFSIVDSIDFHLLIYSYLLIWSRFTEMFNFVRKNINTCGWRFYWRFTENVEHRLMVVQACRT